MQTGNRQQQAGTSQQKAWNREQNIGNRKRRETESADTQGTETGQRQQRAQKRGASEVGNQWKL